MMRFIACMLTLSAGLPAYAQAINWTPHQMGTPVPAAALAGGATGNKIYYVCRKRLPQRWHTGYTFGARCHTAKGMKELRHDKYQIAMPGKNSASLVWRNANNMEKRTPIRAGKRPVNPALCRGTHQGRFRLIGHVVKRGCKAGFKNRSVVMNRYQMLTHNHAGGKVGAQLLGQSGDGLGGSVEGMKQAEIGAALAGVAATQKFDANQFWAGVLKRAERHSKAIQRNQSRSLKDGLGVALNRVLSWNQLQKAFNAVHPNKRIYRNGTGQGRRLKPGAKFGQYDRAFVQFLARSIPANGPGARKNTLQARVMARVYNQALRPMARDFARVQQKLSRNAACRNRMMKTYKGLMNAGAYSPWSNFGAVMDRNYCNNRAAPKAGNDRMGQIALWWMRRYWDGTHNQWANALNKLLINYDRAFHRKLRNQR